MFIQEQIPNYTTVSTSSKEIVHGSHSADYATTLFWYLVPPWLGRIDIHHFGIYNYILLKIVTYIIVKINQIDDKHFFFYRHYIINKNIYIYILFTLLL